MGLFKKKPGGTFFGNLLRAGASKVSGGVLGTGANRIEIGQTKTNAELAAEAGNYQPLYNQQAVINDIIPPDRTNMLYWIVGGLAAVVLGLIAYTQGIFSGGKKSWKKKK